MATFETDGFMYGTGILSDSDSSPSGTTSVSSSVVVRAFILSFNHGEFASCAGTHYLFESLSSLSHCC